MNRQFFRQFMQAAIRDLSFMVEISEIREFYETAVVKFSNKQISPKISIEFYEYVGLRHTIRLRNGQIFVRISSLIQGAPAAIHRALAFILVAKLLKRRVPKQASEIYQTFVRQPQTVKKAQEQRRSRGRKIVTSECGKVYDLNEIFIHLNQRYFQNKLLKPVLTWSQRKTFRIFGHHDALHQTVVISRTLDDKRVPRLVVEFVLYHELLHIVHPVKTVDGRRQIHSDAFKRDEQKFSHYSEAENWLERLAKNQRSYK